MAGTELTAAVTNVARARHAQGLITGKSFRIRYFELGSEGHDPGDPLVATNPDPSDTELAGSVFGPDPVDGSGYLTPTCPYWDLVVDYSEAVGAVVSSVALIAEIVDNGNDPVDEVGVTFPYAIAHMPRRSKTSSDRYELTVGVQL